MKKHLIIFTLTIIFGALSLDLFLGLHYAYSPNEPLLTTYAVWFILVAVFCAISYLAYYAVKWIKNKLYPDISSYIEVGTVDGPSARTIELKLNKNGIPVHLDGSKRPLPYRILVPPNQREHALEVLNNEYA